MARKTRAKKTPTPSTLEFQSDKFRSLKNQEAYEKLNVFRPVWVERRVILDEVDLEICRNFECRIILDEVDPVICRNFECRGWLPLSKVEHPPPAALIREFYSNLSIHSDDSNT